MHPPQSSKPSGSAVGSDDPCECTLAGEYSVVTGLWPGPGESSVGLGTLVCRRRRLPSSSACGVSVWFERPADEPPEPQLGGACRPGLVPAPPSEPLASESRRLPLHGAPSLAHAPSALDPHVAQT
jgi:hypothetical protein